ncbi:MAG: zinc dependent phospholipase C family protein [Eubacteriales bacterium]|nr:zinc dependent phospholipase C family protein [Eubacteriales bacterium]
MPAVYAHDRFGEKVLEQMRPELRVIAKKYIHAFRIGLQGPDIFFFYRPWEHNGVQRYGTHLHEIPARPFFYYAADVVRRYGRDSGQYAYLLGYLCHFTLDSECHPYVESFIGKSGVAHLEIEEEFEKMLLRMDGKEAISYPMGNLISWGTYTPGHISPFYPSIKDLTVLGSLRGMRFVKKLFTAPFASQQWVLNTIMKRMGVYHEMKGLMNQRRDEVRCIESNEELLRRFTKAVPLAVQLQRELDLCIRKGQPLGERFKRTFE